MANLPPSTLWMIAGAVMIALEILVLPGIGFLFAGMGALTVGGFLMFGFFLDTIPQFTLFFISTAVWTGILWKPLKSFMGGKESGFNDMVGETATVYGDALTLEKTGKVKWSGTIMKCRLKTDSPSTPPVEPGTEVTITGVDKGILLVKTP